MGSLFDILRANLEQPARLGDVAQPMQLAHHEQSETVRLPNGRWVNIYGRGTPKAGQRLPNEPEYDTVEQAVSAARRRSQEHGRKPMVPPPSTGIRG